MILLGAWLLKKYGGKVIKSDASPVAAQGKEVAKATMVGWAAAALAAFGVYWYFWR